eukprot:gene11054-11209_t
MGWRSSTFTVHQPLPLLNVLNTVSVETDDCTGAQLGWNIGFSNKFSLGQVLGSGSFGTVHVAFHKLTGSSYAVKVLRKCSKHGMQLEAIKREVATWQQAQGSRYVARIEGLYEDDDHAYILQELCAGGNLKSFLDANGCCTELESATIMRGVIDFLVECHRRNICYGDVKPANILFSQAQQQLPCSPRAGHTPWLHVRAVDFGCSRVSAKGRPLTQCCGSPLYMAPEMALQRYGVGVDVWSAGVMMYQMLTGRLPFWRNKTLEEVSKLPPYEIVAAVRTYEVQYPRELWAHISPEAQQLVSCMLDRNPATRITAEQALAHPWFTAMLGYTPTPSGGMLAANNVLEFPGARVRSVQQQDSASCPGSPVTAAPSVVPLSPSANAAAAALCVLPLTRRWSGDLAAGLLGSDLRLVPRPVAVPAAE